MHRPQEVARLLQPPVVSIPEIVNEEPKGKLTPTCPKCGREFIRGIYMHTKYCKGK